MCAKKERREVYQPVADLDAELVAIRDITLGLNPATERRLDLGGYRSGGGWVGAIAYYGFLENV